ncbi:MAG TPA: M56 family metallopeptidase [Thermoanaerobaculia bacterium]|jgi:beta-lactamase regulating signal transducer with metallopeptidase domain/tetratricopeptide (TPR) repeat protein|nr:M56 family metallopeptidase [Thermoanaerobaculia bacterium]
MSMIDFATQVQSLDLTLPALLVILKATLILAIARLLVLALPRLSAATKHLGITLALCSVIALPIIGLAAPAWRLAVLPTHATQNPSQATKTIGATGDDDELPQSTVAAAITVAKAAGVVPEAKLNAFERAVDTVKGSWQGFIILSIFAASLVFLLRMAAGVVGVGIVAQRSAEITDDESLRELDRARDHLRLSQEVRLLRSDSVSVPVIWGLFKPVLLLPASSIEWPIERVRVVLVHELAHVKRLDGLTLLITKAAVAIFWFHPLMWTLERVARAECERACDDLVLESGTKPSDYAEHLLSIAKAIPQVDPFRSVTLAMSRRSQLEGRLLSILQPHVRRGNFSSTAVAATAVLALLVLVPFASMRLVAAPQPSSSTVTVVADKSDAKPAVFDLQKIVDTTDVLLAKYDRLTGKRRTAATTTPTTGREWYERAYQFHREDHFQEAIEAFKQAVGRGYRVEDAMYNIACGYAQLDDAPNAVKWLRDGIDAGYDNYDHIADDSDFDPIRSDPAFKQILAEAPQREKHKDEGRLDATLRRYETLKRLPSADGGAWFSVGFDLLPLRQLDQSIDAFKQALAKGYKPSTSMYNIACGYSRKGDVASGIEWLRKAIDEGFDSIDKLDDDSDIDNLRKSPQFAGLRQMAEELRLSPAKNIFAKMFKNDEGDWHDSLARFRSLTQKYPSLGRTWFNLGFAALQAGQNAESINSFKRALDLNYRTPTTMYNIACGYARSNQTDAAMEWLQKARSAGFQLCNYIDHDDDLNSLRSDPRFRELRKQVRAEKN